METPSKPTLTTRFELIEKLWHKFNKVPEYLANEDPDVAHKRFNQDRNELMHLLIQACDHEIEFYLIEKNMEDMAIIYNCIVLMEDMSDG